jgi:hypothetical protein
MADAPVDVYTDQVGLNIGPFGCTLNFSVSPQVQMPGGGVAGTPVATLRMSLEHLKLMVFMLRRQLVKYEQDNGVRIPIPREVLSTLRIGLEDWQECWGGDR